MAGFRSSAHAAAFVTGTVLLTLVPCTHAAAQDEAALKSFFEGHRVTVKVDMPGTSDGVDVYADANRPIDFHRYGDELKSYGTAIAAGSSPIVTLVKVKKDLIEFQLAGGGFGTFGDDTSTTVYMPLVEKSEREKDLEHKIKDESDPHRKHDMERELDNLRDARERQNRRIEAEKARAEQIKREQVARRRLEGGSRFNLRYSGNVPVGIRPEEVMAALSEYVDFSSLHAPGAAPMPPPPPPPPSTMMYGMTPRKGMLRGEAEQAFGRPTDVSERREGNLLVVTMMFTTPRERIMAEFVEDVMIRYTIMSSR